MYLGEVIRKIFLNLGTLYFNFYTTREKLPDKKDLQSLNM